ncbi:cytochrome P450 [Sciscionella sediminilitoris]|uniref:cytochrome P450 n=1 Tax=Sciscionella sediminilitoris TaxID=1445613 RepID=UPI0004DEF036|nr:cytochrome P450 [Sciscionella sp. SE31]
MDQLPFDGDGDVLEVPPRFRELQREQPIARVRTLTGDEAWLVTGYDELRELYGNQALGRAHRDPDNAPRTTPPIVAGVPTHGGRPHAGVDKEQEVHNRMRRLLTPAFAAKRMEQLRTRIGGHIDEVLDAMVTPPVDLHAVLSQPLPMTAICEVIGAPPGDHGKLRDWWNRMSDIGDSARAGAARAEFVDYTAALMAAKRREPAEDLVSHLVHNPEDTVTSAEQAAGLITGLLFAGHESTMSRIDLGVLLLIRNPGQRAKLLADPGLLPGAVEEILRMTITPGLIGGVTRWAAHDITIGEVTIKAGDAVVMATGAANYDPERVECPDEFDITRTCNPHMSFGYGSRFCIGASLAKIELQEVFGRLFARFPTLRLAVPDEELPVNRDRVAGGLAALPVAW